MVQGKQRGVWVTVVKVAVSLVAGFVVLVLLFPARWDDTLRTCSSVFGYRVPCGAVLSYTAGPATAVVVALAFWPWVTVAKVTVSLLAGVIVFVLLLPYRGVDTLPPTCWSAFDYEVPCGTGRSYTAGAATAAGVGFAFWLHGRRRRLKK